MGNERIKHEAGDSRTKAKIKSLLNLDDELNEGVDKRGKPLIGGQKERRAQQARILNDQLAQEGVVIFDRDHFDSSQE